MSLLRLRFPLAVTTLWSALLLPALPAGATELSGESENYSATARLVDGMVEVTIVHKVSGQKVSSRYAVRATRLTEVRVRDAEGQVIVYGEVGNRGEIQIEYDVNDASHFDKIHQLRSESERYSVSVRLAEANPTERDDEVLDITVVNRASGGKVSRRSPTRTAKLTEIYILEPEQRLIVHGELGRRGDIVSVVDLKDASVVDAIYGWKASFSPTKTKVAYNFRYPPYSLHQHATSVLLIYDFSATPRENSFRDEDRADPTTRGYVIYPERNRRLGKHFIPAMSEEEQIRFRSPTAWSHSGTRVALLEGVRVNTYLLLVDLAKGLEAPEVRRLLLEKESYYKPHLKNQTHWRRKYAGSILRAKTLKFSQDDQSVLFTTRGVDPFEEQEVVIELD